MGRDIELLCVPKTRREQVLNLAHDTLGGHMGMNKTRQRIQISGLTWLNLKLSCKRYIDACEKCQFKSRTTCFDHVPIKAIPRADEVFDHFFKVSF